MAAFCVAPPLFALTPSKAIRQYVHASWQDPLPHATVLAIDQTQDGYLWLGTYEGLARFDGSEFAVFDKRNTVMQSAAIASLLEDRTGALWIGTISGGLYRRSGGAIARVDIGATNVQALAEDPAGTIWVATQRGIMRIARSDGRPIALPSGAPRSVVRSICVAGDSVWFATDSEGLVRYRNGAFTAFTTRDGLPSNVVYAVATATDGSLWIGTQGGIYRLAGEKLHKVALDAVSVYALKRDRDGNMWISAEGKGVCRASLAGQLDCDALTTSGSADIIRSIAEDREGDIWLGGTNSGLHRLSNAKFTTTTAESGSNSIRSVTESADGTIWTGMEGGGVAIVRDGGLVAQSVQLPSPFVRTTLGDSDGSMWVGTIRGLTHVTPAKTTTYTVRDGLGANMIYALEQAADGTLWIGTSNGVNAFAAGHIRAIPSDAPADVRAIHADRAGRLWVGTRNGLRCLANGRIVACGSGLLRNASIFSFHEDTDGTLWIGTSRGIARMRNGRTNTYTIRDGLFDDVAFAMLDDDQGNLWMSCNRGIYCVRKADFDRFDRRAIGSIPSLAYNKSDGMGATQCNGAIQPAAWKSRDGLLWFATVAGVVSVDPHHISRNEVVPPVVIEEILVDGTPAQNVRDLPAGSRNLEIQYAGLSFVAPEKVRFRYELEGFDRGWVDAGSRRVAYYTNVPPGRYTFHVTASNNDGVWNTRGAALPMRIEARLYETWWFRAIAGVLLAALLVAAYRFHAWQLREAERRKMLEELATTDGLTRVSNRRAFDAALQRMWADHLRSGEPLTAMLCDIDYFKRYNDTKGHQAGDEALIAVAQALRASLRRATDVVARYGGEEFGILLPRTGAADAAALAEEMLDAVRRLRIEHRDSAAAAHVTISVGVASMVPDASTAAAALIHDADEALYRAKENGRDRAVSKPQPATNSRRIAAV